MIRQLFKFGDIYTWNVKDKQHRNVVIRLNGHMTSSCIDCRPPVVNQVEIVSWRALWYRQISYRCPKKWYNNVPWWNFSPLSGTSMLIMETKNQGSILKVVRKMWTSNHVRHRHHFSVIALNGTGTKWIPLRKSLMRFKRTHRTWKFFCFVFAVTS